MGRLSFHAKAHPLAMTKRYKKRPPIGCHWQKNCVGKVRLASQRLY
jgi:hypothetical protein